jgi:hypothetical protein
MQLYVICTLRRNIPENKTYKEKSWGDINLWLLYVFSVIPFSYKPVPVLAEEETNGTNLLMIYDNLQI